MIMQDLDSRRIWTASWGPAWSSVRAVSRVTRGEDELAQEHCRSLRRTARVVLEEFDVNQHQLRRNLPQGFVHALHLETAARLTQAPGSLG